MFRLLVVEDNPDFYEDYLLRIFGKLLPMEKVSVVHVPSLASALVALLEPWDFILMDHDLGAKTEFLGDPVRHGGDLIAFRRAVEEIKGMGALPRTPILGMANNRVSNRLLEGKGADNAFLKIEVPRMAKTIGGILKHYE